MSVQKARGTAWETAICQYLTTRLGRRFRRNVQTGSKDIGDIHCGPFVIEAKDHKSITPGDFIAQAEREAINAGLPYAVAVVKNRRHSVDKAYVMMSLDMFVRIAIDMEEMHGKPFF